MNEAITYIFGTDHRLQSGRLDQQQVAPNLMQEYKDEIRHIVYERDIVVLFEEWTSDANKDLGVDRSVLAAMFPIGPINRHEIDLNRKARELLGFQNECINRSQCILEFLGEQSHKVQICDWDPFQRQEPFCDCTKLANEIRERVWVSRIRLKGDWPALLVCGAYHVRSVEVLLRNFGVKSEILHENFGALA